MAEDYVSKLNFTFAKRRSKLLRLRRQMSFATAIGSAGAAVMLLSVFRLPSGGADIAAWASPIVVLLIGAVVGTAGFTQRSYFKRKYDILRETTMAVMQANPICNCFWQPCSCKEDFIVDMDHHHNINLSY